MREGRSAAPPPLAQTLLKAAAAADELAEHAPPLLLQTGNAGLADVSIAVGEYARAVNVHRELLRSLREGLAEQRLHRVVGDVVAHGALGARDLAALACASRVWRAAVGPHGVARAALCAEGADERVAGCKAVAAAAAASRAGEGEDEQEAAAQKSTFDALLEALLRDGEARVRREAARALWVLSGGDVTQTRTHPLGSEVRA